VTALKRRNDRRSLRYSEGNRGSESKDCLRMSVTGGEAMKKGERERKGKSTTISIKGLGNSYVRRLKWKTLALHHRSRFEPLGKERFNVCSGS